MKAIKTKVLLDPLWMARSKNIDLEYYSLKLMAAKQSFEKVIDKSFSNLQEIIFHYLNINHLEFTGKVYDSSLNEVKDGNIPALYDGFKTGKEDFLSIFEETEKRISEILIAYLKRALDDLSNLEFYFNSLKVHRKDRVYIVFKYSGQKVYEIWKLDYNPKENLGFEFKHILSAEFEESQPNTFKQKVVTLNSNLKDFDPNHNVLVVISNSDSIKKKECLLLVKDMVIVNKSINMNASFDANAMRDLLSVVEKRKGLEITPQPRT